MGSISYYVDGVPVTVSDRTYSLSADVSPVSPAAYKTASDADLVALWRWQPSMRMVTSFLASNVAQVPLHSYVRQVDDGRVRLGWDHPLSVVLRNPGGAGRTAYEATYAMVIDVCLYDRHASRIVLDADGVTRLVRLPPSMWRFERDYLDRPTKIVTKTRSGDEITVDLDDALWIDGFPSVDNTSPVDSLRAALSEAAQAQEYRLQLWANGGRWPGWITRPLGAPRWSTEARAAFKTGIKDFAAGGLRAGGVPVLEDGMDYNPAQSMTPKDGEQAQARQLTIAETANAYHVPPQMVGQDSGSSYNSVSGYREQLYSDTLGGWFQRLSEAYNARLVPRLADPAQVYVEYNVAAKLRLSFDEQARIFQTAVGGPIMSPNEARARMNLPAIGGGEDLLRPLNVGPADGEDT